MLAPLHVLIQFEKSLEITFFVVRSLGTATVKLMMNPLLVKPVYAIILFCYIDNIEESFGLNQHTNSILKTQFAVVTLFSISFGLKFVDHEQYFFLSVDIRLC